MIDKYKIVFLFSFILIMSMSISCDSNLKEVQKSTFSEFSPSGEADSLTSKYTDSGKIQAVLKTSKMKDFGSVIFPFTEFPKGILVTLYDKNAKETFVKSDFATSYKLTDIIDLHGNVKITSDQGAFLETQQLYYDQKNEWFYTEKFFKLTDPKNGNTSGEGIDFNKDFTVINYQNVKGTIEQVK